MIKQPKKIWITPPEQAPMQVDANGDTWRQNVRIGKRKKGLACNAEL